MLKKVEGKIIDTNKIDTQVDDLKKDISKHTLIKTFETYADENVFKQKSTALELFIKNRNEYLPTDVSEVQLLGDHMKKGIILSQSIKSIGKQNMFTILLEKKPFLLYEDKSHERQLFSMKWQLKEYNAPSGRIEF